jgi:putative flippase GtrA
VSLPALLRRQEIAYVIVGAINTLTALVLYAILWALWGDRLHYLGGLLLTYAVAIIAGFTLQRRFVFKVRGSVWLDLSRYTLVQLVALGLNGVVLTVLVRFAGAPVLPSQAVSLGLVVATTFIAHRYFSFRRPS